MNDVLATVGSIALRISVVYVALLIMLRIGGRRELAQLTPADMLLLLLLSEVVSPSLTGGNDAVWVGLLAAALLIALTVLIGWLTFRSRRFEALVEGNPLLLVRNGKVDERQLRSLRITDQQLRTFLHEHGLLRMEQIAVAYVEPSGRVTVVKEDEKPESKGGRQSSGHRTDSKDRTDEIAARVVELKTKLDELEQSLRREATSKRGRDPRRTSQLFDEPPPPPLGGSASKGDASRESE
jgi:uncharacterized membrane protein YcaP (DUF421 family)